MSNRLPRRDYVLLPLLSVVTMLVLFGIAEAASRLLFVEQKHDRCEVADARLGHRYRPDCTSRTKASEGPWVTNHYNQCGSRAPAPCGPKPADTTRVAVIGSSVAEGYLVPYEQSFAARTANILTQRCRRPVEFQDLASIGYIWDRLYQRLDDVLALKPDAVVLVVLPFDLEQSQPTHSPKVRTPPSLMKRVESSIDQSRAVVAAQHMLFENVDEYVSLYLRYGDKADFLRPPFGPVWQKRLADYDSLLGRIANKLREQDVPLLLVFVPQRAQAALLSGHATPPSVDPYAFGQAIGRIAAQHHVDYMDLSAAFSGISDAAQLYYPVDGHLSGDGHAVLAAAVARGLIGDVPALATCNVWQSARTLGPGAAP
jgi:hypothetical protein